MGNRSHNRQRSATFNLTGSFLIALLAGTFGGLVGLGGGVIMIPLMVDVLKLKQHAAHGTSLLVIVFTGIAGAVTYGMHGSVDVAAAALLAATAMITTRAGAHYAHSLSEWKLKWYFGWFIIFVCVLLLAKPYLPHFHAEEGWAKTIVFLATGAFTGFLSGMMGVGGGSIMVPFMVLFAGLPQHLAQGSSLLAMVPAGSVGAYAHGRLGNVRADLLPWLIPGILLGTYVGGTFAHFLPEAVLRLIFSAVLLWTGIRYVRAKRPQT